MRGEQCKSLVGRAVWQLPMAAAGDGSSHRIIEYSFMLESICGTTTCFLMWLWVSLFRTPNFFGWDKVKITRFLPFPFFICPTFWTLVEMGAKNWGNEEGGQKYGATKEVKIMNYTSIKSRNWIFLTFICYYPLLPIFQISLNWLRRQTLPKHCQSYLHLYKCKSSFLFALIGIVLFHVAL